MKLASNLKDLELFTSPKVLQLFLLATLWLTEFCGFSWEKERMSLRRYQHPIKRDSDFPSTPRKATKFSLP
jgi:hypothetical protein